MEDKEEWRSVHENEEYQVSSMGRFKNKNGRISNCKPKAGDGYVYVPISKDGRSRQRVLHRIVAEAFLDNPDNKPQVNHKNGNRADNRVENLEWVTASENGLKKVFPKYGRRTRKIVQLNLDDEVVKIWDSTAAAMEQLGLQRDRLNLCCRGKAHTTGGFRWKYLEDHEIIDGEEWREIEHKNSVYSVSSLGRVKAKSGVIIRGSLMGGYLVLCDGTRVHRLIAAAFCPKEDGKDVVNHKDLNKINNNADNLEWVSHRENSVHAIQAGARKNKNTGTRPVVQYVGQEAKEVFSSLSEASQKTGVMICEIGRVCQSVDGTAKGFGWKYLDIDNPPIIDGKQYGGDQTPHYGISDDDPIWATLGM